jgi:hypothetical protein
VLIYIKKSTSVIGKRKEKTKNALQHQVMFDLACSIGEHEETEIAIPGVQFPQPEVG